jgi:glycyl-tRNA synthetase beta chain
MQTADLLLEIGSEEIPAGYIPRALAALRDGLCSRLTAAGISYDRAAVDTFATPRRLAVRIASVALEQETRTELRLGPAVAAAFDADGNATKAAQGFARSLGVTAEQLERHETEKGERLGLEVTVGGQSTEALLLEQNFLRELLQLNFPKTMRWIPGDDFAFARPIRWLVCLFGDRVLPLQLASLTATGLSRGHRSLAPGDVTIDIPVNYEAALAAASVIVSQKDRVSSIERDAKRLAEEAGGRLHEAEDLLEEVSYLVEHPYPVLGHFDVALVEALPAEVIIAAMRSHQRYFSVEKEDGTLLPCFITFRDGGDRSLQNVVEGNERVLRARLDDARFYWDEDRALSSDEKLDRLDRIVWLEGYGSMAAKSRRIAALAVALGEALAPDVDVAALERSGLLCKTDLATEMIRDGKEFTKLQGVIGRYYAIEAGEAMPVADAIAEHLQPRFAGDRLPATELACLVALADRRDAVAGCSLAGFAPTGSSDLYALRRQAFAVLRLLVENAWSLDLMDWVGRALDAYGDAGDRAAAERGIEELFWGRLETQLGDLPVDILRAVLSGARLDPTENVRSAKALASLREQEDFGQLVQGAKRCRNILVKAGRLDEESESGTLRAALLRERSATRFEHWKGRKGLAHSKALLCEEAELQLAAAAHGSVAELARGLSDRQPELVYRRLASLGEPIAAYFDGVLVNAEEEALRGNRLSFLEDIHYLFARFADLSQISTERGVAS